MKPKIIPQISCKIKKIVNLGKQYYLLTVSTEQPYLFQAGQHCVMRFMSANASIDRYFSIANSRNEKNELDFCINALDKQVAEELCQLHEGCEIYISAAQGKFTLEEHNKSAPFVFVAGGSGIAPMRAFIQELTQQYCRSPENNVSLIYGCRSQIEIPYLEELSKLQSLNWPNLKISIYAEFGSMFPIRTGNIMEGLQQQVYVDGVYFLCGPKGMVDAARSFLLQSNIPVERIIVEN